MNKKSITIFGRFSFFVLIFTMTISCGMSPEYNLDFTAPAMDAEINDVFPAMINGVSGEVNMVSEGGVLVIYGDIGSIYTSRSENTEEALSFFQNHLLPDFKDLSNNFSGNINGQYYAKAHSDKANYFGWVNGNYCFVLKAKDKKHLEILVESFEFISK